MNTDPQLMLSDDASHDLTLLINALWVLGCAKA